MKFLPFEQYRFTTKLPPEKVFELLQNNLRTIGQLLFTWQPESDLKYVGSVSSNKFKIYRLSMWHNSFGPIVVGKIKAKDGGSVVNINMRLNYGVLLFLVICLTPMILVVADIITEVLKGKCGYPVMFGPLIFIAAIYLMTMIGFKPSCNKWKIFLARKLEANSSS